MSTAVEEGDEGERVPEVSCLTAVLSINPRVAVSRDDMLCQERRQLRQNPPRWR